jgi:hypothetical protein
MFKLRILILSMNSDKIKKYALAFVIKIRSLFDIWGMDYMTSEHDKTNYKTSADYST